MLGDLSVFMLHKHMIHDKNKLFIKI